MNYILIAAYLLCSVGGLTLVKIGGDVNSFSAQSSFFTLSLSYSTLIGLILYIFSFLLWMIIIQRFNLSYIQPIATGLSYVLIILVSVLILKESISAIQWVGLIFVLIGVVLMNLSK